MKYIFSLILILSIIFQSQSLQFRSKKLQSLLKKRLPFFQNKNADEYTVHYFTQAVDHLQFNDDATFEQKYLVRDKYYKEGGPIFFYAGNEGPIEMFYENSGFLNNVLAEYFGAMIVYMEHRYYGDSWPFGNEEESYKKKNLVYLTSLQALYDYNIFIDWYKKSLGEQDRPVVAFGGSYGGMLATWMRMKFPNSIDGAIGASAPIVYFMNREGLDLSSFYQIATVNYEHGDCAVNIKESFDRLEKYKKTATEQDLEFLSETFDLCTPLTKRDDIDQLIFWINEGYSYMAMTNYPYETSFLKTIPAWPANTSCIALEDVNIESSDQQLFKAIEESVDTFYNYDGSEPCNEIFDEDAQSDDDMSGWLIQACSDMVMPMDSTGDDNMFPFSMWDSELYTAQCYHDWGLYPGYDWALDFYGGKTDEEFSAYSNIFLSNGTLDPWAGGGVYYQNEELDFNYILMSECAHHLDLREPNIKDPQTVDVGRQQEIEAIQRWIDQKNKKIQQKQQQQKEKEEIFA